MTDAKPDLDAIEARAKAATEGEWVAVHNHEAGQLEVWSPSEESYIALIGADDDQLFIAHAREDVPALVAYARTLEAALDGRGVVLRDAYNDATRTRDAHIRRALAAEAERDQLRDTLALRSAAHNRLAQRLDQVRALADEWAAPQRREPGWYALQLRRVLDGDQQTEQP